MRVEVGGQRDHDWAAESAVDVVGDDSLQNGPLKDAIEAPLVAVEFVGRQCRIPPIRLRLHTGWLWGRLFAGSVRRSCAPLRFYGRRDYSGGRRGGARMLKVNCQGVTVER